MIEEPPRVVTENDFRKDEFKGKDPKDYEFDSTGCIVRKDRFRVSMRAIASVLGLPVANPGWTCEQVVEGVEALACMLEEINNGGKPAVMCTNEAIHKLQALGADCWEIQQ